MKNSYLQIRVSEKDKEQLQQRAEELQLTMSEYIIRLIQYDLTTKALK